MSAVVRLMFAVVLVMMLMFGYAESKGKLTAGSPNFDTKLGPNFDTKLVIF